jgi:hypothetical protein
MTPSVGVPRYLPERALPPYAFVPGVHPHPTRDPRGHSFGAADQADDGTFLWGVDLYNHGYFWEAHEAWESLWRRADRDSAEAEFLQGLIQCAAACMKVRSGQSGPARRISQRAGAHLAKAVDARADSGELDLPLFAARFCAWIDSDPPSVEDRPRLIL